MSARLQGSVVVVTGGGSGIGRAIVERFHQEGAQVIAGDLRPPPTGGGIHGVECDVTSEDDVRQLLATAGELGPVGVVVTSAGTSTKSPVDEIDLNEWCRLLDLNLTGTMLAIKHGVGAMKATGTPGSIVAIASVAAFRTSSPFNSTYAASKGGVVAMVKALVHELSPHGIRVNAIAPGVVESPLTTTFGEGWNRSRRSIAPLGRLGQPGEIADVALFLASAEASYVTGQLLVADGGATSVVVAPPI